MDNLNIIRFSWLTTFFVVSSLLSFGQDIEADTIPPEDSTALEETKPFLPVEVYLEGVIVHAPTPKGHSFSSQLGVGLAYKRLSVGAFRSLFQGEYTSILIFPNEFELTYAHGGGYLGYKVLDKEPLEASIRVNFSQGDMVWERTGTNENFARDKFQLVKPEITLSLVPARLVKVYASVGYSKFTDLGLPSITSDDFSGLTLGLGLKLGYFKNENK